MPGTCNAAHCKSFARIYSYKHELLTTKLLRMEAERKQAMRVSVAAIGLTSWFA